VAGLQVGSFLFAVVIGMIQLFVSEGKTVQFQIAAVRDLRIRIDVQSVFELHSIKSVAILVLIEEDRYGEPTLESARPSGAGRIPAGAAPQG